MRILHSADWHMGSPMQGFEPEARQRLQRCLLEVPGKIAAICRQENCDLVLLCGDIFDKEYNSVCYRAVYKALEEMRVPVFISPGNHDYYGGASPWDKETWPGNVHIFTTNKIESVAVTELDARVYGLAFTDKDCPAMLEGFRAQQEETYALGVFHGDPGQTDSPYNPITAQQVRQSGLTYMALGHIHKGDVIRAGDTLCQSPGCPMGTGFHEPGTKGVLVVDIADSVTSQRVALDVPNFYDIEVNAGNDPVQAAGEQLPAAAAEDFYRITFTGESDVLDLEQIRSQFPQIVNLVLRDKTVRPVDIWANAGEDSFEGVYFGMLKDALESAPQEERQRILLAAKLSRQLLEGQEVVLP